MLKNILVVSCLGTLFHQLGAVDVDWIGTTPDLSLNTNWTGGVVPTTAGTAGGFNTAGVSPTLSGSLTLGSIDFPVTNTTNYIFQLEEGSALTFAGAPGVTNESSGTQNFLIGVEGAPGLP